MMSVRRYDVKASTSDSSHLMATRHLIEEEEKEEDENDEKEEEEKEKEEGEKDEEEEEEEEEEADQRLIMMVCRSGLSL